MHLDVFFALKFVMRRVRVHHWQRIAIVDWTERLSKVVLSIRFTFVNSVLKIFITLQSQILSAVLALINNGLTSQNKNDGLIQIETPWVQRKHHEGSIGADSGHRTRRTMAETIRDELPNLPDNNTGTTCPSNEGDLMDTIPGNRQNSEIGKGIHVVVDDDEGTFARYAV